MAQGGGRGWFHRKRSQPNPDEHGDGTIHARTGEERQEPGSADPASEIDDLQRWSPELRRVGATDQPTAGGFTPAMGADLVNHDEPSPARTDTDRADPVGMFDGESVDQTLRPRPQETDSRTAATAPVVPTWAAPSGSGDAADRVESEPVASDQPSATASPVLTSGIDWDAATAAALSEEPVYGHPTTAADSGPPSNADRLLEDIIREIVGDAAADTVSSLGAPRFEAPQIQSESLAEGTQPAYEADARSVTFLVDEPSAAVPAESASAPAFAALEVDEHAGAEVHPERDEHPETREHLEAGAHSEVVDHPEAGAQAEVLDHPEPGEHAEAGELPEAGEQPATSEHVEAAVHGNEEHGADVAEVSFKAFRSDEHDLSPRAAVTAGQGAWTPRQVDIPAEAVNDIPQEPAVIAAPSVVPIEAPIAPQDPDVSRETSHDYGGTPLAYELADETRRRIALDEAVLPLPPATRIFTISNQKGGVGKTTSAVNLAAALARSGARVLVVDLDPQGNASTALGVDHRSERQSVYEVLVSDLSLGEVVQPSTEHERLDCVPATIHLAGAEIELVSLVAREQRLRRALDAHLASMEKPYDYVFIDCPPSLGLLTINAFVAAREVLIPIQCEYYALEGLSQLLSNIELIEKHLNPELRLSTILLTMYDSRTNLAQQVAQEVRNHFPTQTLETIIPRSVRVSEAPSYGQSVISYDYASSGSLSYREAAAEIARRSVSNPEESH